jgi:hypothetical protein
MNDIRLFCTNEMYCQDKRLVIVKTEHVDRIGEHYEIRVFML